MLTVLSPSKTLDEQASKPVGKPTYPDFLDKSQELIRILKGMSQSEISSLMGISSKLAELNHGRFKSFTTPFNEHNSKQAILSFKGDVYDGLNADDFVSKDFEFAQSHLRIISGLYGLIKPLDLIQPYRLEMGTKLKNKNGKNLYKFWGDQLTDKINKIEDDVVLNLASKEYFNAIDQEKLKSKWVTAHFKEFKGGDYKVIGLFAKKARGMMARYIIKNSINDVEKIMNFNEDGYSYSKELSDESNLVFTRKK